MTNEEAIDPVSREAVCEIINDIRDCISVEGYCAILERMKKLPSVNPQEPTWVTGSDGAKIAFKDVPAWKVTKICEILADVVEAEEDQEPKGDALNKIRTKIEELADADGYGDYQLGFSFGLMMAMEIIDKHKAESDNCN